MNDELCTCGTDEFQNTYVGNDARLHCSLCDKLVAGWESLTIEAIDEEAEEPCK